MKKLILMASAALAFGGVAIAQDAAPPMGTTNPDAASQPGGTPDMGAQSPAGQSAPGGQMTPDAGGGTPAAPPAPGGDASGGMAPGGAGMSGGGMAPGTATGPSGPVSMTPTQGPTDLPACSKTVTDNCKQGAGGGKSHGHHSMHHKKK